MITKLRRLKRIITGACIYLGASQLENVCDTMFVLRASVAVLMQILLVYLWSSKYPFMSFSKSAHSIVILGADFSSLRNLNLLISGMQSYDMSHVNEYGLLSIF